MTAEFTLPKGIDQETYDKSKEIILSGFAAKQDADTIKSALFSEGVPFSKLAKVFVAVTKAEGLSVDVKSLKEKITEAIAGKTWTFEESWNDIKEFSDVLVADVKGMTKNRVFSMVKAHFLENEVEMPRKTAPKRGRMGIINKTLIDVFAENPKATEADLVEALKAVTKTEKNANDYAKQNHKMLYAVANGLTSLKVLTELSDEKAPVEAPATEEAAEETASTDQAE